MMINNPKIIIKKDNNFTFINGILKKYIGLSKEAVIPEGTVRIDKDAFKNCEYIENVEIPNTVKTIGERAFSGCVNLKEIILPSSVLFIENEAFSNCEKLEKVRIDGSLTCVSKRCFYECKGLISVYLSDFVKIIDEEAFYGCSKLEKLRISGNIEMIGESAFERCISLRSFYSEDETKEGIVFPESLIKIHDKAFLSCFSLEEVSFGNKIESIGKKAFSASDIKSLYLPESLSYLGENAFSDCKKLKKAHINGKELSIETYTFRGCIELSEIVFGAGVSFIANKAFWKCKSINKIIPNSILYEKTNVFWTSAFEESVVDSIRFSSHFINSKLFKNVYSNSVSWFKKLLEQKAYDKLNIFFKNGKNISFEELEQMEEMLFDSQDAEALEMVISFKNQKYPPKVIESIENEEFEKSLGLKERTISDWRKIFNFAIRSDCVVIGGYKRDKIEKHVIIPETIGGRPVTIIGEEAFKNSKIESIYIPESVSIIKKSAFMNCEFLKRVNIPSSVKILRENLFCGCVSLENLEMASPPEVIESNVFKGCPLTELRTFEDSLYFGFKDNPKYALISANKKCSLFNVQKETKIIAGSAFFSSEAEIINVPYGVLYIGDKAFFDSNITKLDIPESVVEIGHFAFMYCYFIEVVRLPASVKKIGKYAFNYCNPEIKIGVVSESEGEKYVLQNCLRFFRYK